MLIIFSGTKGIANCSIETTNNKLIHSLSQEELQELKLFFRYLFAKNGLGYPLFGDKPMSFCFLPTSLPRIVTHDFVFKIFQGDHSFKKGVAAWDKLKKETNSNYILIFYENHELPSVAFFVNKKAFTDEFNKNIDAFKKHYRSNITPESFLEDLKERKTFFDNLIYQHLLLGILFGYGRHNAELFQRRWILSHSENKIPFSLNPKPNKGFSSIEEELIYLKQHLQIVTHKCSLLSLVTPVNFAADPSWPHTILLKKKYASVHKELTNIFKRDDWLDIILSKLMEN